MKKLDVVPTLAVGGLVAVVTSIAWWALGPTVAPDGPRPPIIIKGRSLSFALDDKKDLPLEQQASTYNYLFRIKIDHLDGTLFDLPTEPEHYPQISRIDLWFDSTEANPDCSISLDNDGYLLIENDTKLIEKTHGWSKKRYWTHQNEDLPSKLKVTYKGGVAREFDVNKPFDFWIDYP